MTHIVKEVTSKSVNEGRIDGFWTDTVIEISNIVHVNMPFQIFNLASHL